MVQFNEAYAGGFFGWGRTYGANVRFEFAAITELDGDWSVALGEIAKWRTDRGAKATALHFSFQAPKEAMWDAIAFAKANILVPPHSLAPELQGLTLCVYVFTPDVDYHFYAELYADATRA